MKLITKVLLLAAAALALAAGQSESPPPQPARAEAGAAWQAVMNPESFVPPAVSWSGIFSAGGR